MSEFIPYAISIFVGVGLAAASGFRVFLPLFAVSLASFMGWIPVSESFVWLSSLPVLIATAIATVVEIIAYYIPYIDNILDSLSIPLATIAGSVLFASQFIEIGTFSQWALALIAGGGTAATIATGFAGTRGASTVSTGGIGNHLVSTTETIGASIMSLFSLVLPIIAFFLSILLVFIILKYGRKIWYKFKNHNSGLSY